MSLNRSQKPSRLTVVSMTVLALLTALVVILQLVGSFIRFGTFSVSLVLIPIVIGAALCGPWAGAWLGFIFGLVVLMSGDAAVFLEFNAFGTVVTVLAKGIGAGFCAGLVYRFLEKKNALLAVTVAAVVCPIVNTGVFLLLCAVFFLPLLETWSAGFANVGLYMIVGLVGLNFVFETAFNLVLSPVILRLLRIAGNRFAGRK